ncbi:hypothetical protein CBL_08897 [Carabus blaptoides fortunei]
MNEKEFVKGMMTRTDQLKSLSELSTMMTVIVPAVWLILASVILVHRCARRAGIPNLILTSVHILYKMELFRPYSPGESYRFKNELGQPWNKSKTTSYYPGPMYNKLLLHLCSLYILPPLLFISNRRQMNCGFKSQWICRVQGTTTYLPVNSVLWYGVMVYVGRVKFQLTRLQQNVILMIIERSCLQENDVDYLNTLRQYWFQYMIYAGTWAPSKRRKTKDIVHLCCGKRKECFSWNLSIKDAPATLTNSSNEAKKKLTEFLNLKGFKPKLSSTLDTQHLKLSIRWSTTVRIPRRAHTTSTLYQRAQQTDPYATTLDAGIPKQRLRPLVIYPTVSLQMLVLDLSAYRLFTQATNSTGHCLPESLTQSFNIYI